MTAAALPRPADRIAGCGRPLYFEISPLFEVEWTGIPVVAAGLARALIAAFGDHVRFFYQRHAAPAARVAAALAAGGGRSLLADFAADPAAWPVLTRAEIGEAIAIFPSVKPIRGVFAIECSLFHDLSTLITPQFHEADNIRHHVETMLRDRATNAVTFAVSQASADDLGAYFGDDGRTFSVANGVAWPDDFAARAAAEPVAEAPYFLVLGTREPRKNIRRLFEALTRFPDLLAQARFVVAGKMGWLMAAEGMTPAIQRAVQAGRIVLPGYVSEFRKYCLLRDARALIYPSVFEGFGLPVLESLSVGTPCVASFSASIPEVGGAQCRYFDPFSAASLHDALGEMLAQGPPDAAARAAIRQSVAGFTWAAMLAGMLTHLAPLVAETGPG